MAFLIHGAFYRNHGVRSMKPNMYQAFDVISETLIDEAGEVFPPLCVQIQAMAAQQPK